MVVPSPEPLPNPAEVFFQGYDAIFSEDPAKIGSTKSANLSFWKKDSLVVTVDATSDEPVVRRIEIPLSESVCSLDTNLGFFHESKDLKGSFLFRSPYSKRHFSATHLSKKLAIEERQAKVQRSQVQRKAEGVVQTINSKMANCFKVFHYEPDFLTTQTKIQKQLKATIKKKIAQFKIDFSDFVFDLHADSFTSTMNHLEKQIAEIEPEVEDILRSIILPIQARANEFLQILLAEKQKLQVPEGTHVILSNEAVEKVLADNGAQSDRKSVV